MQEAHLHAYYPACSETRLSAISGQPCHASSGNKLMSGLCLERLVSMFLSLFPLVRPGARDGFSP